MRAHRRADGRARSTATAIARVFERIIDEARRIERATAEHGANRRHRRAAEYG